MCQNQLRKSGLDLRDLDLGVGLPVALRSAIAFFRLHLVNADLLALAVFDDVADRKSTRLNSSHPSSSRMPSSA